MRSLASASGWPINPYLPPVRKGSTTPVPLGQIVRADETDPFLSTTARLGAAAPFQVLSDGLYVYVFRQAITDPSPKQFNAAQLILLDPQRDTGRNASRRPMLSPTTGTWPT